MNIDRYEKIDGREALKRLAEGEEIYTSKGSKMRLDFENHQMVNGYGGVVSFYPLHAILTGTWYIPKPFDVRQAMLDHPNEWVGAYKKTTGEWLKIGFSTYHLAALVAPLKIIMPVSGHRASAATVYIIDNCIPIEDVPTETKLYGMKPSIAICDEEAKR